MPGSARPSVTVVSSPGWRHTMAGAAQPWSVAGGAPSRRTALQEDACTMRLEIFSDTICPWRFVGKRRLEPALRQRPQHGPAIRWRALQLHPRMAAEGMDRKTYFLFNGRFALSGAQEPEALFQLFDLSREDDQAKLEASPASVTA